MSFNHTGKIFPVVKACLEGFSAARSAAAGTAAKVRLGVTVAVTLLCLTASGLPSRALAQAATAAPQSEVDNSKLEEIIVTARKRAEDLQVVPISVTALGGNDLREKAISNPYELT